MKIFFGYDYALSGTESVLTPIAHELGVLGHHVTQMVVHKGDQIPEGFDRSLRDFDIAHFWNIPSVPPFYEQLEIPFGVTIHGFMYGAEERYFKMLRELTPDWIHVMDEFTLQRLGQENFYSTYTPQCITTAGWKRAPEAEAPEKSIGYLGDDPTFDHFETIEAIAKEVGIPCFGHNASDLWLSKDQVRAHLVKMAIFVNCNFGACGPVTAQEAMMLGRPVLTTPTTTMIELMTPGFHGEFFDGSVEDGVRKVKDMFEHTNYNRYHPETIQLHEPSWVAGMFEKKLKEVLS